MVELARRAVGALARCVLGGQILHHREQQAAARRRRRHAGASRGPGARDPSASSRRCSNSAPACTSSRAARKASRAARNWRAGLPPAASRSVAADPATRDAPLNSREGGVDVDEAELGVLQGGGKGASDDAEGLLRRGSQRLQAEHAFAGVEPAPSRTGAAGVVQFGRRRLGGARRAALRSLHRSVARRPARATAPPRPARTRLQRAVRSAVGEATTPSASNNGTGSAGVEQGHQAEPAAAGFRADRACRGRKPFIQVAMRR